MTVIIGILAIILFGYLFVNFIYPKFSVLEKITVGYLLGIGIFTLVLFVVNIRGIPYGINPSSIILLLLIIISIALNYIFKTNKYLKFNLDLQKIIKELIRYSRLEKFLIFSIAFLAINSFLINIYWPVTEWDSLVLYDFRAKIFPITGFMNEAISLGYFFGYPLLTSLAHMWVYLLGGENPMFLYSLFYLSLIICFYFALTRSVHSRKFALLFTLLLAVSNLIFEHSTWAYTNLPYSIFLFTGITYGYLWQKEKDWGLLFISAIFVGLSIWTRTAEPFWLGIVLTVIIFLLIKKKILQAFIYPVIVVMIRNPWIKFNAVITGKNLSIERSVTSSVASVSKNIDWHTISIVGNYLWTYIISRHLLLLLIFLISLTFLPKMVIKKDISLIHLTFAIFIIFGMVVLGTYIFSYSLSTWNEIGDSAYRMTMFIIPLILYYVALVLNNYANK
jgi:hypothetical protein